MLRDRLKINSNWLLLGAALLLGGGAAYLGNNVIRQHMQRLDEEAKAMREPVKVVVAKVDLKPGDPISSESFAVRLAPREFVNADAVTPQTFGALEHQRLATAMRRGDILLPVHADGQGASIFSATLTAGRRALTFEVDTVNSISGMLRPGDRIDLLLSGKVAGSPEENLTRTLLSNVLVLATDQSQKRRDEATGALRDFSTVTLDLTPAEAQRVIVAKQAGKLTALLRHPDDKAANPTQALSAAGLFADGGKVAPQVMGRVEYIVGGGAGGPADVQTQLANLAAKLPALGALQAKP